MTSRMFHKVVMIVMGSIFTAGCFYPALQPNGYTDPQLTDISIVPSDSPSLENCQSELLVLPIKKQQDGTKLVLDFLQQAKDRGATLVSGLRIQFVTNKDGQVMRCETQVQPMVTSDTVRTSTLRPGTGTTRTHYVLKPVTQYVTEYQYQCHSVSRPVTRTETYYSYEYDYYSKTNRSVPRTRTATHYQYQNECKSVPVSRTVTRYDYQLENQYVPPQWDYLARTYSKWQLVESEPSCETMADDRPTPGYVGKIVGLVHFPKGKASSNDARPSS